MNKHDKNIKAAPVDVPSDDYLTPTYGFDEFSASLPQSAIPQASMDPRVAKKLIDGELDMDFRNSADLGSYITDYMDPEADALIQRTLGKVFIDKAEYPRTAEMARRVGRMVQNWYNGTAPTDPEDGTKLVGAVPIGSSQAIHLGMIAARRKWELK
ncbi:MAG: hypothetical protein HRU28_04385 [Rhizobiales bacterium]|nr:hypothetical protein [Hyphomicrobiales bacterium]